MITTLIIEDEQAIRKEIAYLVGQHEDFTLIGTASGVAEAVEIINIKKPQLVLMDIQLTDGTAFELLDRLAEIDFQLIFITAYNHFAIKAIKYGSLDYLLKPIDENELAEALSKIKKMQNNQGLHQKLEIASSFHAESVRNLDSRMVLPTLESLQVVQLKEIIYCQSDGGYTWFYLSDGEKILLSKPLKHYEDLLPEEWFLRPHQSYLVNIMYVDKYLRVGDLLLKNKVEIPVSTRRKEGIIQRIMLIK